MRRFSALIIFFGALFCVHVAISAMWTDNASNNTFSFTGTTVSTSTAQSRYGMIYYQVSGSADISGTADPLGDDDEYEATMWLETSGKDSGLIPGRGNIDTNKKSGSIFRDEYSNSGGKVLYTKHIVASVSPGLIIPGQHETRSMSDSCNHSYVDGSYLSPTGLSASPHCSGNLSGTLLKAMGNPNLDPDPLSFSSKPNPATGDTLDDGSGTVAAEKCDRKGNCNEPMTATALFSHRVDCPEEISQLITPLEFFGIKIRRRVPCESRWWTCDDLPDVCPQSGRHVPKSDTRGDEYVDAETGLPVSPGACGHYYASKYAADHVWGTAPCGDATHTGYLCQINASDHEWVYETCSSLHAHYECDGTDHSLQASCTSTDSNGNSCTVTSFYACDGHTPLYPPPPPPPPTPSTPPTVACGGAAWTGCTASVSSRTEHKVSSCSNCPNHYWTCMSGAVDRHTDVKTCKRSGCGATLTPCQNGPGKCTNGGYHWL